jgi:hypothetical protein
MTSKSFSHERLKVGDELGRLPVNERCLTRTDSTLALQTMQLFAELKSRVHGCSQMNCGSHLPVAASSSSAICSRRRTSKPPQRGSVCMASSTSPRWPLSAARTVNS